MLFLCYDTYRLAGALARACVCARALAANGQAFRMTHTAIRLDSRQALEIADNFAAKVAFELILAVGNDIHDFVNQFLVELACAHGFGNTAFFANNFGASGTDTIDVSEREFDALVIGNIYS